MPFSVTAVVLTNNRPASLAFLLGRIRSQSLRPRRTIVIDTGSNPATPDVVAACKAELVRTGANVGAAAGFALGMLLAQSGAPDFIWLMDDDGYPEDDECLETLATIAEKARLDLASPLIIDPDYSDLLAFPHRVGGRYSYSRAAAEKVELVRDFVHLFNGALIRPSMLFTVGLPDARLFIRGDEVDYWYRAVAAGCKVATVTKSAFCHPSGRAETVPIIDGWLHAVVPPSGLKRDMFFRNRGYLFKRHAKLHLMGYDVVRYATYFLLIERGNLRGLIDWARATLRGIREAFDYPAAASPPAGHEGTPAAAVTFAVSHDPGDGERAERTLGDTQHVDHWRATNEIAQAPVS